MPIGNTKTLNIENNYNLCTRSAMIARVNPIVSMSHLRRQSNVLNRFKSIYIDWTLVNLRKFKR